MMARGCLFCLVSLLALGPATAQPFDSAYTRIGACDPRDPPADYAFLISFIACEGYGGWTVFVGATEQTTRLAFGEQRLEQQFSESPINAVGAFSNTGETIEWRLSGREAFATIVRWRALRRAERGFATVEEYLVVSKLERRNGPCHIAYVDARAVSNANSVARRAADRLAADFPCGSRAPFRIGPNEARRLTAAG